MCGVCGVCGCVRVCGVCGGCVCVVGGVGVCVVGACVCVGVCVGVVWVWCVWVWWVRVCGWCNEVSHDVKVNVYVVMAYLVELFICGFMQCNTSVYT